MRVRFLPGVPIMGVEYAIYDLKNKQVFDLRKGPYGPALEIWLQTIDAGTLDAFIDTLLMEWERWYKHEVSLTDLKYIRTVAKYIWEFCEEADWNIEIYDDCLWPPASEEQLEWPIVLDRHNDVRISSN